MCQILTYDEINREEWSEFVKAVRRGHGFRRRRRMASTKVCRNYSDLL